MTLSPHAPHAHTARPTSRAARPRLAALGVAALALAMSTAMAGAPASAAQPEGRIIHAGSATAVPGSYIVVFKDAAVSPAAVVTTARSTTARYGGSVVQTYDAALRGFELDASATVAARIAADLAVAYVQQNQVVRAIGTQPNPPSWGLDRIDQRNLPLDNSYTYPTTGAGVRAYIIDTGIRFSHNDFGGRAVTGYDAVDGGSADDCNGHGTHVAGTVGGSAYGVAKSVQLVGVRVLNCQGSGTSAGVVAGINWVTSNAVKPAVANMSLGGGADTAIDNALNNSINSGVSYAVAAGNSNANACNYSPARVAAAITVGATTNTDARASYSNYGSCLDIFAPGSNITSAWYTSNTATNTISGTSMASPHVAGAAAQVLETSPGSSPAQVRDTLVNNATTGVVTGAGTGSPNRLLYVGSGSPPPPPPPSCSGTNPNDVAIPDYGAPVTSSITITGCGRAASSSSKIDVNIIHTWRGDLVIDLVAPDGSSYRLKNSNGSDSADNVIATYTVNLSSEAADGTWRLRVQDVYRYDTGYINSWTVTL